MRNLVCYNLMLERRCNWLKSAPFCYACAVGFLGHMLHEYHHRVQLDKQQKALAIVIPTNPGI